MLNTGTVKAYLGTQGRLLSLDIGIVVQNKAICLYIQIEGRNKCNAFGVFEANQTPTLSIIKFEVIGHPKFSMMR